MDISDSPVFKYIAQILDIHTWPGTEEKLAMFGDSEMAELSQNCNDLLSNASCKVEIIPPEWELLKPTCYLLSRIILKPLILIFGKLFS